MPPRNSWLMDTDVRLPKMTNATLGGTSGPIAAAHALIAAANPGE